MSYRSQIPYKYLGLVDAFSGALLAVSIASSVVGVWKASLRWKYLNIALAVAWLIPFVLYAMSFAGPLFDMRYAHFTW